ncbi:MAG: hypothetical protein J6Z13_04345 [Clostridia bacterium]|nr:hypothetical protein [Clostridia bacterium]
MKILSSILLVAAAANVASAVAPRGKTRRAVLFSVALSTLLALILPILSALGELPVLPEPLFQDQIEIESADPVRAVERAAENALSEEIARRFGVEPPKVNVALPTTGDDPGSIRVVLAAGDGRLADKIAAWLKSESRAAVTVLTAEETE